MKLSSPERSGATGRTQPSAWWVMIQLWAFASLIPLSLIVGRQRLLADATSAMLVATVATTASLAVFLVMSVIGINRWTALEISSVGTVLFWSWPTADLDSGFAWTVFVLAITLLMTATWRMAGLKMVRLLIFTVAVTLMLGATALAVWQKYASAPSITIEPLRHHVKLEKTPDIVLVVVDGYARNDVLLESFGYDNKSFTEFLERADFVVSARSKSNYSTTHLSLASMLNMALVVPQRKTIGDADLQQLARIVSSENWVVQTLRNEGYRYVHGDVPYRFSYCGAHADVCLSGPPIDFTTYGMIYRSPLGHMFNRPLRNPAAVLNHDRVGLLLDWPGFRASLGSQAPVFVFVHLILPHPPLMMDSGCGLRHQTYDIHQLGDTAVTPSEMRARQNAWLEQLECANRALRSLVASADSRDLIIITSDHGPDFAFREPIDQLTETQLKERFSTFTAVRLPSECRNAESDILDMVNVFSVVFSCLSDETIEPVAGRYFATDDIGRVVEYLDLDG